MKIKYQSSDYSKDKVTGRYVRCEGHKGAYVFKVFETETCASKKSQFFGQAGMGSTIREYETDGADIPDDVKKRAIASKSTELWDNPK